MTFDAASGDFVTVETFNVAANAHTLVELYDTDGTSLLDFDDIGLEPGGGIIEFNVTTSGRYYVKITNELSNVGVDTNYDLRVYQPTGPCGVRPSLTVVVHSVSGGAALGNLKVTLSGGIMSSVTLKTSSTGQVVFSSLSQNVLYTLSISDPNYSPYVNQVYVGCVATLLTQYVYLTPNVQPAILQVSPSQDSAGPTPGTKTFTITNTGGSTLIWSANILAQSSGFTSFNGASSGSGNGSVTIQFSANETTSTRRSWVRVDAAGALGSGAEVYVQQAGDTTPPVVTLLGSDPVVIDEGQPFVDPGATATDTVSGDRSAYITTSSRLNTAVPGSYTVIYSAPDIAGNVGHTSRTVTVRDTTPPVITPLGNNPETVEQYAAYLDAGATATDNVDGNVTANVQAVSTVDTSTIGNYSVTYTVTDSSGNPATPVVRTVHVVAATHTETTIGPAGGTISRDGITVTILPGALTAPTLITIDRAPTGSPSVPGHILSLVPGTSFLVGPTGLTGAGGVDLAIVTIEYPDADQDGTVDGTKLRENHLVMLHVDEFDLATELGSVPDPDANTVTATTKSFSTFELAESESIPGLPIAPWAAFVLCSALGILALGAIHAQSRHPKRSRQPG